MVTFSKSSACATAAALCVLATTASAQNVINSNTTIYNSLCVGFDCANSEAYGSDTIRLKENNLRIHFDDTSTASSFPRNDWRIIANDQGNGGLSYLAFEDTTAGRKTFRVTAGARLNALVVDAQGDIGIGTGTPSQDIEVVTGNTPTLRLRQDGSSGFTAQTWDVAGNEAGFFIRDTTSGSKLPFRIIPGASSNSLVVDDDDDVGIGAGTNPEAALHVRRTGATASRELLRLENTGGSYITMENASTAESWFFTHENNAPNRFLVSHSDGGVQMALDRNGNMELSGDLTTTGAVCGAGCDRVFDADYPLPSIPEQAALMFENRHLPNVGPTPEDGPFNVTQKVAGMLNELEKAHIYIAELHGEIATLSARLEALETRTAD